MILLLILDYKLSILKTQDQLHKQYHRLSKMFQQYLSKQCIFYLGFLTNFSQELCQIFSIIIKEVKNYTMEPLTFYPQFLQAFNNHLISASKLFLSLLLLLKTIRYPLQVHFYEFIKLYLSQLLNNLLQV
jgi:hypothetical protein